MRQFTLYHIALVLCLLPAGALGQAPGTAAEGRPRTADSSASLEPFVAEVLRDNPALRAAHARVQSSQARIAQAQAWEDPQAGVEFYSTPVTSLNPFRDGTETDYFIQQMIPISGKNGAMGEAAAARVRVAEQSAAVTKLTLVLETKRAYAMLYSAQRHLDVNTENQRLLNQIIQATRAKYSVGLTGQGDVLKGQVELAKLQNDRATLEQELRSAEAMMNALRSVPAATPLGRVKDITPERFNGGLDSLQRFALQNRPEILSMTYEVQMNAAELSASQRERIPDLMIRGTYKQMTEGTDMWAAMMGVSIPLAPWGVGKYSGKVEEMEAAVKSSQESLVDMQNMVQAEVADAYGKVQSRWEQVERYRTTILPQSEQALQSVMAAYQTDKADFLSLLDAFRMLEMVQMEYYMAVGEYAINLAVLERMAGGSPR